jgi:hypothetical protein
LTAFLFRPFSACVLPAPKGLTEAHRDPPSELNHNLRFLKMSSFFFNFLLSRTPSAIRPAMDSMPLSSPAKRGITRSVAEGRALEPTAVWE